MTWKIWMALNDYVTLWCYFLCYLNLLQLSSNKKSQHQPKKNSLMYKQTSRTASIIYQLQNHLFSWWGEIRLVRMWHQTTNDVQKLDKLHYLKFSLFETLIIPTIYNQVLHKSTTKLHNTFYNLLNQNKPIGHT